MSNKNISLARAIKLINAAVCVRVDSDEVLYPEVDTEEQTITLSLNGGNKVVYIPADGNKKVALVNMDTELRFIDDAGNTWDLQPLTPCKIRA